MLISKVTNITHIKILFGNRDVWCSAILHRMCAARAFCSFLTGNIFLYCKIYFCTVKYLFVLELYICTGNIFLYWKYICVTSEIFMSYWKYMSVTKYISMLFGLSEAFFQVKFGHVSECCVCDRVVFMRRAFHVFYSEPKNLCEAKYWIFVIYDVCAFR